MRSFTCDHCDAPCPEPIELGYWLTTSDTTVCADDDDAEWTEWHLCSWQCLTSFAMSSALDGEVPS